MSLKYRTYDRSWSRTGYAPTPQYPGQEGTMHDFVETVTAYRSGYGVTADGRLIVPMPIAG